MDLDRLLRFVVDNHASDLHLQVGSPPMVRLHSVLTPVKQPEVTQDQMQQIAERLLSEPLQEELLRDRSADFAYTVAGAARFRVNLFYERERLSAAFRRIPPEVPPFETLNLPKVIQEIALAERGLVLVGGATGSGKSTTLAAMIDYVNQNKRVRIITVEDPIEFVHTSKKSLVAQREVGPDTPGFNAALRRALRQDPDVILIGELRDRETMQTAIQAADTGHTVYGTVHTTTAAQTIQRLLVMFPQEERHLLLTQLATNLEAVINQRLARAQDGKGRVPVIEILRSTPIIRKLILEDRCDQLSQAIAGREQGMRTFDQHLTDLYDAGMIRGTEALRLATNPEAVALGLRGIRADQSGGGLIG